MAQLLVVDDEPRIARFVSRALESHGHTVEVARTGEDALLKAAERDFGLIILDLLLPGLDGHAVLREMLARNSRSRVLMLSAVGDVESRVRCLRAGAVDYLAKPFAVAELLARVDSRLTEAPATAPQRWLQVGAMRLDLQRRVLYHGERATALSQREFILLGHLMRRAGEVCTRDELLSDVWGFCFDPGSNVLEVYVGRLRAKIDSWHIETGGNVGLSFSAYAPAPPRLGRVRGHERRPHVRRGGCRDDPVPLRLGEHRGRLRAAPLVAADDGADLPRRHDRDRG